MFSTSELSIEIERILSSCSPTCIMIPSDVLNIPRCTHGIPHIHHEIPQCTEHPPMYSWYPPDVLMVSPRCTEHTLYRVMMALPEPDTLTSYKNSIARYLESKNSHDIKKDPDFVRSKVVLKKEEQSLPEWEREISPMLAVPLKMKKWMLCLTKLTPLE